MDEQSCSSLTDISLEWVCHNVEVLCVAQEDGSLQFRHCPLFPQELADQLLHRMADEGVLNDRTIGIFKNLEHLRLQRAYIQSSHLSAEAFRLALCPHKLQELNASHIHSDITISDVLHSITSSKVCRQGLQTLLMNGLHLYGEAGEESLQACFSMLRSLKKLSLAWTDLDDKSLEDICTMPMLESLDISGTNITDLTPLLSCDSRLRSLTAHGLQKLDMPSSSLILVLSKLQLLRHLDISNDKLVMDGDNLVQQLLERPGILPHLVSLDVSGWRGVSDATIQAFVEVRPDMRFIGLLATGAGGSELLCGDGNLKVAGESNLTQLCEALRRYSDRESFIREVLTHLYSHTSDMEGPQPNILKLVLAGMQHHTNSLHVQLVATACVFNLTVQELVLELPLHLVGTVVQQLLTAMKNFPNHEQNNVAEVEDLRMELMNEDLVEYILTLLINPVVEVDVSYFAGGILAHLISVRGPAWDLDAELHCTVQEKLHSSVLSWSSPEHAMVSYRTFQPFYPLLHVSQCSGVQLWALWAIRFVCSQNAPQYCSMLQTEGGTDILRVLSTHPDTHSDVKCLVENILKILERQDLHPVSPGSTSANITLH
ncbi:protein zyg-11 homolog isoform X6 [Ctenopharyngodon idella]|uniref:protein zyg-11 homolog isoform X6 n=1 Tax=Ctenopharyngodon idella TaxID=7959 RepID=UPI00222FDE63|nr:protein zyg-11 homolog isoform X6 [Ctenopharyngodon idella]